MINCFEKDNDFLVVIQEEDRRFIYDIVVCSDKFTHFLWLFCSLKLVVLLLLQIIEFLLL